MDTSDAEGDVEDCEKMYREIVEVRRAVDTVVVKDEVRGSWT